MKRSVKSETDGFEFFVTTLMLTSPVFSHLAIDDLPQLPRSVVLCLPLRKRFPLLSAFAQSFQQQLRQFFLVSVGKRSFVGLLVRVYTQMVSEALIVFEDPTVAFMMRACGRVFGRYVLLKFRPLRKCREILSMIMVRTDISSF